MMRRLVLVNSAWMMADKIVRLGVGLIVWVWLARHFGPEGFGLWNYAIAFTALFGAIATLGMDGVLVREMVRDPSKKGVLLGTALVLRLIASALAAIASIGTLLWLRPGEWLPLLLVTMNATVLVLNSSQVIDLSFQARMNTRPAVLAVNMAFLVTTVGRLGLLAIEAPMSWFAATLVFEAGIAMCLLVVAYRTAETISAPWIFSTKVAGALLRESWPLILSSLAVMIYMRMDQVMLASMAGDNAVGQFSAALRISEVWYFVPMAIASASLPLIAHQKQQGTDHYLSYLQRLYDALAWIGIAVAVTITIFARSIINLIYGDAFSTSATVLAIQIWTGVTVALSFACSKWMLIESLQMYNLAVTAISLCINLILNFVLIPKYGAIGAAVASLIAQSAGIPIHLMIPRLRPNALMMLNSLTAPLRRLRSSTI